MQRQTLSSEVGDDEQCLSEEMLRCLDLPLPSVGHSASGWAAQGTGRALVLFYFPVQAERGGEARCVLAAILMLNAAPLTRTCSELTTVLLNLQL